MNMKLNQLKELIRQVVKEENEYQNFFKKALEKSGKSIAKMSDDEKKAFFNKIDAAWDGKDKKNEVAITKDTIGEGKVRINEAVSKGDLVFFTDTSVERGMSISKGKYVGRVSKVIGSRNIEVIGVSSKIKGDTLKVQSADVKPFPVKGKKIRFKAEFNNGAGSGSQSFEDIEGVVINSDPTTGKFSIKTDDGEKMNLHISNILSIR